MSMEVLEALACIAAIDRKSDNLFRHAGMHCCSTGLADLLQKLRAFHTGRRGGLSY